MSKKRYRITVSGKVQGVYFRASTKEVADHMELTGFCRNEPNGDVYIEAEGEEHELKELVAWCHDGPRAAQVEAVKTEEVAPEGYANFSIRASGSDDDPYGPHGER